MMIGTYAQTDPTGLVTNVIVLDPDDCGHYPTTALVHLDPLEPRPGIGWRRDHITGAWTPPAPKAGLP